METMLAIFAVQLPCAMILAGQAQEQTYIVDSMYIMVTTDCHFDIFRTAPRTFSTWHLLTAPILNGFASGWQHSSRSLKYQAEVGDAGNVICDIWPWMIC